MFSGISSFWIKGSVELFSESSVRVFSAFTASFCVMMFLSGSGSGSGSVSVSGVATGALTSWVFIVFPDSFWVASISGVCNRADTDSEPVSVEAGPHPVAMTVDTSSKVITLYM